MNEPEPIIAESGACAVNAQSFGSGATLPLLLSARNAAAFVGVSERTWRTWDSTCRVPAPIHLGRSKFWSPFELIGWVQQRCPRREASS